MRIRRFWFDAIGITVCSQFCLRWHCARDGYGRGSLRTKDADPSESEKVQTFRGCSRMPIAEPGIPANRT